MGVLGRGVLYASLLTAVGVSAVGAAAQESLPGDSLYAVKLQLEEVRMLVAPPGCVTTWPPRRWSSDSRKSRACRCRPMEPGGRGWPRGAGGAQLRGERRARSSSSRARNLRRPHGHDSARGRVLADRARLRPARPGARDGARERRRTASPSRAEWGRLAKVPAASQPRASTHSRVALAAATCPTSPTSLQRNSPPSGANAPAGFRQEPTVQRAIRDQAARERRPMPAFDKGVSSEVH